MNAYGHTECSDDVAHHVLRHVLGYDDARIDELQEKHAVESKQ